MSRRRMVALLMVLMMVFSFTGVALAGTTVEITSPASGGGYAAGETLTVESVVYDSVYGNIHSNITWQYLDADGEVIVSIENADSQDITLQTASLKESQSVRAVYDGVYDEISFITYNDWISSAVSKAVQYLKSKQNADGSFAGGNSVAVALAAAGVDLEQSFNGNDTYIDYLKNNLSLSSAALIDEVRVLKAMGKDPSQFSVNGKVYNLNNMLKNEQLSDGTFGTGWKGLDALAAATLTDVVYPQATKDYFMDAISNGIITEAWGEDMDATARALVALEALGVSKTDSVVANTLAVLNGRQDDSGLILTPSWTNPSTYTGNYDSSAEVARAIIRFNIDPTTGQWKKENGSLISGLLQDQEATGRFNKSTYSTQNTLLTLVQLREAFPGIALSEPLPDSGGNGSSPDTIQVSIEVLLPEPDAPVSVTLTLEPGTTVLEALLEIDGLSVDTEYYLDFDTYFVNSINGFTPQGSGGWMYQRNGVRVEMGPDTVTLHDGDEVVWYYGENAVDDDPYDNDSGVFSPQVSEELQQAREEVRQQVKERLTELADTDDDSAHVLGHDAVMDEEEMDFLEQELAGNRVEIEEEASPDRETTITDDSGEVSLLVPEQAVSMDTAVTVTEVTDSDIEDTSGETTRLSSVYNFGPDGTVFNKPVQLRLKAVLRDVVPEAVRIAWYDEENRRWQTVPTVVDVANGEVTGLVGHFTKFAVVTLSEPTFNDVSHTAYPWAFTAVEELAAQGVINGVGDGAFAPDRPVTRAEFTKMLTGALGIETGAEAAIQFTDVAANRWYAPFIAAAYGSGLVGGYEDGTFKPNAVLNRQEMTAMVVRAVGLSVDETVTAEALAFADRAKAQTWAVPVIKAAVDAGLVNGVEDNRFAPLGTATRAQAAVIIWRAVNTEQ